MIDTYHGELGSITRNDHSGRGRPTIEVLITNYPTESRLRKFNRELAEHYLEEL